MKMQFLLLEKIQKGGFGNDKCEATRNSPDPQLDCCFFSFLAF